MLRPVQTLALLCNPLTPAPMIRSLEATVSRLGRDSLIFSFSLAGNMTQLRIPEPKPEKQAENLWEHTCFEVFVGIHGENAYREFNFSPSGEWAIYAFSDYRQREDSFFVKSCPEIRVALSTSHLKLDAVVPGNTLPSSSAMERFQIGLSAVLESDSAENKLSYWALNHPVAHPDFHRRETFTLELGISHESI